MSDIELLKAQRDQLQHDLERIKSELGDDAGSPHGIAMIEGYKQELEKVKKQIADARPESATQKPPRKKPEGPPPSAEALARLAGLNAKDSEND